MRDAGFIPDHMHFTLDAPTTARRATEKAAMAARVIDLPVAVRRLGPNAGVARVVLPNGDWCWPTSKAGRAALAAIKARRGY